MPFKDPSAQRQYQREWMAKRRSDWFAENGPCVRCGSWDKLQLDHIDRTEKVSHRIWNWSKARRDAEAEKCQVLCYPCHVKKTAEYGDTALGRPVSHGDVAMYTRRGCRCDLCKQAKAAYYASRKHLGKSRA